MIGIVKTVSRLALALPLAALIWGCDEREALGPDGGLYNVVLSVSSGSPSTRVSSGAEEERINTVDFYLFDSGAGTLASGGHARTSSSDPVVMRLPEGEYDCYAVVNSHLSESDLASVGSLEALSALTGRLADESVTSFCMVGHTDKVSVPKEGLVTIPVLRQVARVVLKGVMVSLREPYASYGLTVNGVYMTNVVPTLPYSMERGIPEASTWFNPMGYVSSAADHLIHEDGMDAPEVWFYVMPNPVADDTRGGDVFSPRYTRLVIDANIGGQRTYYPIDIPDIRSNHSYEVTGLVITGPGADTPEGDMPEGLSLTVRVLDWEREHVINEES